MTQVALFILIACLTFSPSTSQFDDENDQPTVASFQPSPPSQPSPVIVVLTSSTTTTSTIPLDVFNNSTVNSTVVTPSTTENVIDIENLLNVTSELQLEKVNKDEECQRQLFISDKCLKKVIFLAKDSSLPRSLNEASNYCK